MKEKRTYPEAVEIMINWWMEKSFNTAGNWNNGDNSAEGGIVWALANTSSMKVQAEISDEQKQKFKTRLTELLLTAEGKSRWENELNVDYNPNEILYNACKYAGISTLCLPCKTFTFINENNMVEGRYQYGGSWFKI